MGGALALHMAYRYRPGFAAAFTLSSFLNNNSAVYKELKSVETELYMCHGDRDSLVPLLWGDQTRQELADRGVNIKFNIIKNAMHELKKKELTDLMEWIEKKLPSQSHL